AMALELAAFDPGRQTVARSFDPALLEGRPEAYRGPWSLRVRTDVAATFRSDEQRDEQLGTSSWMELRLEAPWGGVPQVEAEAFMRVTNPALGVVLLNASLAKLTPIASWFPFQILE